MDRTAGKSAQEPTQGDSHPKGTAPAPSEHDATFHVNVHELSRAESLAMIAKHHVGRVGLSFHDVIRVKLCAYVYSEGWIYARTELGPDLTIAMHHPWAAFEIGEVDGVYDWTSVEAWGAIEFLNSDVRSRDWFEFENAVNLLRGAVPQILTADDPMPERVQLLRVHVDNILGRQARSGRPEALPRA